MQPIGKVGILGGGSWATAMAKIVLSTQDRISWFLRRKDQVAAFIETGYNPDYLRQVHFDTSKIDFFHESQINNFFRSCDTILLVTPSPYFKGYMRKVKKSSLRNKLILNAIKGIVPDENTLITDYLQEEFEVPKKLVGVVSGPSHAEEVAKERYTYLTVTCYFRNQAEEFAKVLRNDYVRCVTSVDIVGVQYASVLKNIYAIASGICDGLQYGDNFQSVLVSNAIAEMNNFVNAVHLIDRNITDSVYLGDLLVTAYSQHSRNRTFGTLIGKGYSVKNAQLDMEMIAEGYYGAKCIHELNAQYGMNMPIADTIYRILYEKAPTSEAINSLAKQFK